jgi:3-oxoacyl-[acyl-carrier protein] reductase
MEHKKSGKIINIAIAGIDGYSAFNPAYCATKGAVLAFVAVEVAGANIFVNAIACGGVLTQAYRHSVGGGRNGVHQLIPLVALDDQRSTSWPSISLPTSTTWSARR